MKLSNGYFRSKTMTKNLSLKSFVLFFLNLWFVSVFGLVRKMFTASQKKSAPSMMSVQIRVLHIIKSRNVEELGRNIAF